MAIYEDQVSERLAVFLDNHCMFEDVGDAENGPKLDKHYAGPQWALDLYECATDWSLYQFESTIDNFYPEV